MRSSSDCRRTGKSPRPRAGAAIAQFNYQNIWGVPLGIYAHAGKVSLGPPVRTLPSRRNSPPARPLLRDLARLPRNPDCPEARGVAPGATPRAVGSEYLGPAASFQPPARAASLEAAGELQRQAHGSVEEHRVA